MTKTTTVTSKAFVAIVAAAMVFSLVAPAAKAATAEELQAQITALMAQISALSGGTTTTTTTTTSAAAYTFTRSLTLGSTGADVTALQTYLISKGHAIAAGATGYFGAQTAAAVAAWQTANGIAPAAGFFGPVSQAKYMAMMASTPTTPTTPGTTTPTTPSTTLKGEASLTTAEIADGEDSDNVEEGSEDVQIGEITVEFSDGDAKISRVDVALEGAGNTEQDPWDIFDELSLWVDGKKVADIDSSDKDNYLDEDDGSLRFTGLDIVAMEDKELVIVVGASITSSVDDAGSATLADWDLRAGSIRFEDAEGVVSTEGDEGDLDDTFAGPTAEFTIDEAGAGDDLNLEDSDENPDATTLKLSEDDNTELAIFAFDLSAEDSDGDVTINEIKVNVAVTGAFTSIDALVNDFRLEIGGDSYDVESYTGTGSSTLLTFDVNGDTTIDADDIATAVLYADFENMDVAAREGSTITATVSASNVDAEGSDDISVDGSSVSGNEHTLRTSGVAVEYVSDTVTADENNDASTADNAADYSLKFEVTSFDGTVYLPFGASRTTALGDGVEYAIVDTNTNAVVATGTAVAGLTTSGGSTVTKVNSFKVGSAAVQFTLNVNFDPAAAGSYKLRVNTINFASTDVVTGTTAQDVSELNIETDSTTISN